MRKVPAAEEGRRPKCQAPAEIRIMEKAEVISFFDHWARSWDEGMVRNEEVIKKILDNAGVGGGLSVLDVGCGTGVLFPDYFSRGVSSLTGIDISPEMAKRASAKFPAAEVICADVEEYPFDRQFDVIMVYNAFPHFPDPARLIERLASLTKPGGRLSVAHGMSRARLIGHHSGSASRVSVELPEAEELAALFASRFCVDTVISDDGMYQVAGTRKLEI